MRYSAIMVATLALAACMNDTEPVAESSGTASLGGSVTYKYADDIGEAATKAGAYCAKYRKRAWLRTTSRVGNDNLATYDCR